MPATLSVSKACERPPIHRFTRDGSRELEEHLSVVCDAVRSGVLEIIPEAKLEGLLLGGGYGRGEGGVLRSAVGDQPYNDLEFYVMVKGSVLLAERRWREELHACAEELSGQAGVEVEFKLGSFKRLRAQGPTMFSYDLVMGHHWLVGNEQLLHGCESHRDAAHIPLSEAARLLMNRCSGLLFSKQLLEQKTFDAAESDFVERNLAKAELGFGDVVLASQGRYHWSCLERHRRVLELPRDGAPPGLDRIRAFHAHGVEFKLHPYHAQTERTALHARHAELCQLGATLWLWLESIRLGRQFSSMPDYVTQQESTCPETEMPKNWLINLRTFGLRGAVNRWAFRYPRERLLRVLPLLLFLGIEVQQDSLLREAQRLLQTQASSFSSLVEVYRGLWARFN